MNDPVARVLLHDRKAKEYDRLAQEERALRAQAVIEALDAGVTGQAIGRALGVSKQLVYKMRKFA